MRLLLAMPTLVIVLSATVLFASASARAQAPYVNFETVPTRALALSPDGSRLFATNTPDGRLEIFDVTPQGLRPRASVSVGLDPVAVAAHSDAEVWVVNLLSDSVSVVDVAAEPPRVVRTLLVGDEPRDIVFAGPDRSRAFITAARRGQNHPADIQGELQTPGVGRADVWVFDANRLGEALGGEPIGIVQLFADKPGPLAVSADGRSVFVAIATSGNGTTVLNERAVCGSAQDDGPCPLQRGGSGPGGIPAPNTNAVDGTENTRTGLIVKNVPETGAWLDGLGRDWRDAVPFELPDNDVFVLDASADPPRQRAVFRGVGTLNKNVAIDPASGDAFVATIEAINTNRFLSVPRLGAFPNPDPEPGVARTADPATGRTLNGHLYESRVAILSPGAEPVLRRLNKHIDYEVVPSPPGTRERSVADPQGLVFSADGETLFVAGLGSNAIVPFRTAELRSDSFTPDASTHIRLSGNGGPTDMVLERGGGRMFVYKRFDNAVATVDLEAGREIAVEPLASPEPAAVRQGRVFFYDAQLTSSNGEANCNVCHPAADKDDLAWNLGSPFEGMAPNPNPLPQALGGLLGGNLPPGITAGAIFPFNPLKGPMTVLTLRGIADGGPMFWRGDASNSADPGDERANFRNFNVVFEALLGREEPLEAADFERFTDWVLTVTPPPNPHRPLNGALNPSQEEGRANFFGERGPNDSIFNCQDCHGVDPAQAFFGTRGEFTPEGEAQEFKVTGLRLVYDKIGMFGQTNGVPGDPRVKGGPRTSTGPQIRGSGTLHDGSNASPEEFLSLPVMADEEERLGFALTAEQIEQVVNFLYAFPTNLAPVVGQQVTLRARSGADVRARVDLLEARAAAPTPLAGGAIAHECELVAKVPLDGRERGFLFDPDSRRYQGDAGDALTREALRALADTPEQPVTFTCVYPGGGRRLALDRDQDGRLDGMP